MKEPKTVLKHTRTISTYYLSDGNGYELFKKLERFLGGLTLPDIYKGGDAFAVASSRAEIDEIIDIGDLENALYEDDIPYDMTMEQWNERKSKPVRSRN